MVAQITYRSLSLRKLGLAASALVLLLAAPSAAQQNEARAAADIPREETQENVIDKDEAREERSQPYTGVIIEMQKISGEEAGVSAADYPNVNFISTAHFMDMLRLAEEDRIDVEGSSGLYVIGDSLPPFFPQYLEESEATLQEDGVLTNADGEPIIEFFFGETHSVSTPAERFSEGRFSEPLSVVPGEEEKGYHVFCYQIYGRYWLPVLGQKPVKVQAIAYDDGPDGDCATYRREHIAIDSVSTWDFLTRVAHICFDCAGVSYKDHWGPFGPTGVVRTHGLVMFEWCFEWDYRNLDFCRQAVYGVGMTRSSEPRRYEDN